MKAAILKNGKTEIVEMPKPILGEYDYGAVVKVLGCGLCGSDIVKLKAGLVKDGTVLGHEAVGEIVEIHSNTSFCKGDKVALGHHVPCFNCQYCRGGSYSMCRHFKQTNIAPGGFAEYIFVSEEHLNNTVFNINPGISDIEASFLEPLGCCIRAVKRAKIQDNYKCLVIGLGSIGILMGGALNAFGNKAYGCDIIKERVIASEKFGFEKSFLLDNEQDVLNRMKQETKIGFDTVFLTAGASGPLDFAVKSARDGANIVVFSSVKDDAGFKNNDIYYRELNIMGSYSPSPADLEDSMHLIEEGRAKVSGLSTVYSIERLNQAIADTLSNKIMKAYIRL